MLNPERPAALGCRTHLLGRQFDILGQTRAVFRSAHKVLALPNVVWLQVDRTGAGPVPHVERPLGGTEYLR